MQNSRAKKKVKNVEDEQQYIVENEINFLQSNKQYSIPNHTQQKEYDEEVISDAYRNPNFYTEMPKKLQKFSSIHAAKKVPNIEIDMENTLNLGADFMDTINKILPYIDLMPAIGTLLSRFMKRGLDLGFEMIPMNSILRDVYEEKMQKKNSSEKGIYVVVNTPINRIFMASLKK
jgi:hypothetical protein